MAGDVSYLTLSYHYFQIILQVKSEEREIEDVFLKKYPKINFFQKKKWRKTIIAAKTAIIPLSQDFC